METFGEINQPEYRAIYLEFQETKPESSSLRPFHHCRLVVTDVGQHQNGEPLISQSTGRVYDRLDGKVIGTKQNDRTVGLAPPERYNGLPEGYYSVYYGFTTLSFDEIQTLVDESITRQRESGREYHAFFNNCADAAHHLASLINAQSEKLEYRTQNLPGPSHFPGVSPRQREILRLTKRIVGTPITTIFMQDAFIANSKTFETISARIQDPHGSHQALDNREVQFREMSRVFRQAGDDAYRGIRQFQLLMTDEDRELVSKYLLSGDQKVDAAQEKIEDEPTPVPDEDNPFLIALASELAGDLYLRPGIRDRAAETTGELIDIQYASDAVDELAQKASSETLHHEHALSSTPDQDDRAQEANDKMNSPSCVFIDAFTTELGGSEWGYSFETTAAVDTLHTTEAVDDGSNAWRFESPF